MTDDAKEPLPTQAEENPWYLLATLFGVPMGIKQEPWEKNRVAWNRYFASRWTEEQRKALENRVTEAELSPYDEREIAQIRLQFRKRANNDQIEMPKPDDWIVFSYCHCAPISIFEGYVFGDAYFNNATFYGGADFRSTTFLGIANFSEVTLLCRCDFSGAKFFSIVDFDGSSFFDFAPFYNAIFVGIANFRGVTFAGYTWFNDAIFHDKVIFTDAKLKAPADFGGCHFEKSPPQLAGASMHQRTNWRRVLWPRLNGLEHEEIEALTDAYCILKLEMEKQKRHEDELMFFALELQCRQIELGLIKGLPVILYGCTCDYGKSYLKPFIWLVALFNVGAPALFFLQPDLGWAKSVGLSAVNCLAGLGLRKELMGKTLESLGTGALIVSGVQMVFGLVFLFLIGLGLRNRFRMK